MLVLSLTSVNELSANANDDFLLNACIIKIANNKDSEALSTLYKKTSTSVYAFSLSILKNTHDAQDVLHDCYINIFTSAHMYKSTGKPMAWVMTIAKNLCLQKLRARKKTVDIQSEDWEKYMDEKSSISQEDKQVLNACITRLNDEERQIVILHVVSGFKHREIAQIMNMNLSTVLSKYNRALKKLKDLLEKGEMQL